MNDIVLVNWLFVTSGQKTCNLLKGYKKRVSVRDLHSPYRHTVYWKLIDACSRFENFHFLTRN